MTDRVTVDFTVKPVLTGDRVLLRPFGAQDLPALAEALRDPEILRLTGSVHAPDEAFGTDDPEAGERFRVWRNAQTDRLDLAVVERETSRCVGEVVLNEWDPGNRSCNFRTFLVPGAQNRGLGTEALRLVLGHGFEALGLHRISLEVYAFNPRARRVYEKVGFVAEGVLRQSLHYDGRWIDATVMSVLEDEWAGHRGRPARSEP